MIPTKELNRSYLDFTNSIYPSWDKLHPDRFSPGEIPLGEIHFCILGLKKTPIQQRIEDTVTNGRGYTYTASIKLNPQLEIKQFYSDGTAVDWNNLGKSNREYMARFYRKNYHIKSPGCQKISN